MVFSLKGWEDKLVRDYVLNALRHQWYFHTLFGSTIEAIGLVLNALRHQWYFHL